MPTTSDAVGSAFERAISRAVNEMMSSLVRKLIKKAAEELGIGQLVREMTELTKEPWTSSAYKTVEAAAKVEDELKRINSLLPEPERFDFERRGRFVVYPKRAQEHIETAEKNCDVLGIQLSDHMLFEQESSAELDRVKNDTIPRLNREFGGEWEGVLIRDELKRAVDTEFAAKLAEELRERGVFCSASNGVLVFRISDTDAIIHAAEKALGGEARLVDQLKRDLNPDQGEKQAEASHDMQGPATPGQLKFIDDLYAAGEITDKEMADFKLDETAQAASDLLTSKGRELKEKPTVSRAEAAPSAFASTAMANTLSVLAADNMIDADKYANFKANMTVANFHLCIEKGTDSLAAPDALQRRAAELMQKQGVPIGEDDYRSVESLRWAMDRRTHVPARDANMLNGETSDIALGTERADAGETKDLSGSDKTTVLDGNDKTTVLDGANQTSVLDGADSGGVGAGPVTDARPDTAIDANGREWHSFEDGDDLLANTPDGTVPIVGGADGKMVSYFPESCAATAQALTECSSKTYERAAAEGRDMNFDDFLDTCRANGLDVSEQADGSFAFNMAGDSSSTLTTNDYGHDVLQTSRVWSVGGEGRGASAPLQDIPPQQTPTSPSPTAPIANPSAPAADTDYLKMATTLYGSGSISEAGFKAVMDNPTEDTFREACRGAFDGRTEATTQVMDVPGVDEKTHVDGTQIVDAPAQGVEAAPVQTQQQAIGADSSQQTGPDIARQSMEAQRREDIGNTQTTADYVQSKPDTGDMDPSTPYGDQCDPSGAGDKDGNGVRDAAEDFDGDGVPNTEDPDSRPPVHRTVDPDMYPVVEQEDLDAQIASAETSMHLDSRSDRGIETHNDRNITGR